MGVPSPLLHAHLQSHVFRTNNFRTDAFFVHCGSLLFGLARGNVFAFHVFAGVSFCSLDTTGEHGYGKRGLQSRLVVLHDVVGKGVCFVSIRWTFFCPSLAVTVGKSGVSLKTVE